MVWLPPAPPKAARTTTPKRTKAEQKVRRRLESQAERKVEAALRKGTYRAVTSKTGEKVVGGAVKAGKYLLTPVGALARAGAGTAAGTLGLVIAAGVGSFVATSAILKKIRDRRERAQAAAFEAAQAMRRTRLDAEARLGRPLTKAELAQLKAAFDLDALMRKAGL